MRERREKVRRKPESPTGNIDGTVDNRKFFCKRDTTNWSYKSYELIKNIDDTFSSYQLALSRKRHNETILKMSPSTTCQHCYTVVSIKEVSHDV